MLSVSLDVENVALEIILTANLAGKNTQTRNGKIKAVPLASQIRRGHAHFARRQLRCTIHLSESSLTKQIPQGVAVFRQCLVCMCALGLTAFYLTGDTRSHIAL
jgi:hypothetical protein